MTEPWKMPSKIFSIRSGLSLTKQGRLSPDMPTSRKYVYKTEAILHDMYHYLFHYGPELVLTSDDPGQTPAFYGVLNVYQRGDAVQ